jgi:hypothetical protein
MICHSRPGLRRDKLRREASLNRTGFRPGSVSGGQSFWAGMTEDDFCRTRLSSLIRIELGVLFRMYERENGKVKSSMTGYFISRHIQRASFVVFGVSTYSACQSRYK